MPRKKTSEPTQQGNHMAGWRAVWIPGLFLSLSFPLYANSLGSGFHLDNLHVLGKFRFQPLVWTPPLAGAVGFSIKTLLRGIL